MHIGVQMCAKHTYTNLNTFHSPNTVWFEVFQRILCIDLYCARRKQEIVEGEVSSKRLNAVVKLFLIFSG